MSASPIRNRFTAALDKRSSHSAHAKPVASDNARAQSRAACAAGPSVPSIDSGNPTTSPAAPCLRASAAISAAFTLSLPRRNVACGLASISVTSDSATPMLRPPGSNPSNRAPAGTPARSAPMLSMAMRAVMVRPLPAR